VTVATSQTAHLVGASTTTSEECSPDDDGMSPDPWVAYRPVHARRGRQATVSSTSGDQAASWPRAPAEARINARAVLLSRQCSTDSTRRHRQSERGAATSTVVQPRTDRDSYSSKISTGSLSSW
jgi:hypothetical protein